jgi:5S rRNA maturation endonuclease (ribonuclease M5)
MNKEIEAFLELKNLTEKMNDEIPCIIVEGKKDKEALRKIGYRGKIVYAYKLKKVESKVAILTDFDMEGKEIAKKLIKAIGERNVDKNFRNKVRRILKSIGRNDIQSISNLCEKYESII